MAIHKLLPLSDEAIVQQYESGISCSTIAKACNCDKATVRDKLIRLNIPLRTLSEINTLKRKELNLSDIEIKNLYVEGLDATNIAKIAGCDVKIIIKILNHLKVDRRNLSETMRKFPLNENFFDSIDTEAKAYFLGLMYADGNNYVQKNRISIGLQERDRDILEKFSALIFNDRKELAYLKSTILEDKYVCSPKYKLVITNKHMSEQLVELGCVPKKSLILKFPTEEQVPTQLMHHFIRGYFDGDGCIHISKRKTSGHVFSLCGASHFLLGVQKVLNRYCTLNNNQLHKKDNIFILAFGGNRQIKQIKDYLYKDATLYLERKFQKFQLV